MKARAREIAASGSRHGVAGSAGPAVVPSRPIAATATRPKSHSPKTPAAPQNGNGPKPRVLTAQEQSVDSTPIVWRFLDHVVEFFSSLRLTIVCLLLGLVLVFTGTLAQVDLGLYRAQNEFFRSFVVFWGPKGAAWKVPVLPGGYLVGGVLLLNLIAAHIRRFHFTRSKIGIWLVHAGIILLLLGQLLTDMLSKESMLRLREGQSKNYSEIEREAELAVIDTTQAKSDKVVAIPQGILSRQKEISHPELSFKIRVRDFFANSHVHERPTNSLAPPAATRNIGSAAIVKELPHVTSMDERDVPSAVIEIITGEGSIGTWLVSEFISEPQDFSWNNHDYQLVLRPRRLYKPHSLELLKFSHVGSPGTELEFAL